MENSSLSSVVETAVVYLEAMTTVKVRPHHAKVGVMRLAVVGEAKRQQVILVDVSYKPKLYRLRNGVHVPEQLEITVRVQSHVVVQLPRTPDSARL